MQITMDDIAQYHTPKAEKPIQFNPELNRAMWELTQLSSEERGDICEHVIAREIEHKTGYKTTVTSKKCEYDIAVALEDRAVKVEVKSALFNSQGTFNFQGLTLEREGRSYRAFDFLFCVFLHPTGTTVKWCMRDDVYDWIKHTKSSGGKFSFQGLRLHKLPDFLRDLEDFPY
tara:strand:+ start:109 stop:627 length:519 start_codon:yes stop_codon:yes gene_type:complete